MFATRFQEASLFAATACRRLPASGGAGPNEGAVMLLSRNDAGFPLILSETSRKTGTFAACAPSRGA
jgi:hypothetical protein